LRPEPSKEESINWSSHHRAGIEITYLSHAKVQSKWFSKKKVQLNL
jgi:hypothetical protein